MIEEFFVLTQTEGNIPSMVVDSLSREIKRVLPRLISQTTLNRRVGTTSYAFTVMRLQLTKSTIDSKHPRLIRACKKEGVEEFGSGPNEEADDLKVLCLVHNRKAYDFGNQNQVGGESNYPVGEWMLQLGKHYYQMPDFYSSVADTIRGLEKNFESVRIEGHSMSRVALTAYPVDSLAYEVESFRSIACSEANIASFLTLMLTVSRSPNSLSKHHPPCDVVISQVTVELYEVRSCLDVRRRKFLDTLVSGVSKRCLFQTKCWEPLKEEKGQARWELEVPSRLYDRKLPQLGTTFFSSNMSRTYALKVTLRLECEQGCSEEVMVVFEVNIAKEDYRNNCSQGLIESDSDDRFYSLQIERFPLDQYNPSLVAANLFSRISASGAGHYQMHETKALCVSGHVNVLTWVRMTLPASDVHQTKAITSEDLNKAFADEAFVLRCAVLPESRDQGFNLGIGILRNDPLLRYVFPWRQGGVFQSKCLSRGLSSESFFITHSTLKGTVLWSYAMELTFVRPTMFIQRMGANIVLPFMKLLEFVKLQVVFTEASITKCLPRERNFIKFTISHICVEVEELRSENNFPAKAVQVVCRTLYKKGVNFTFSRKQVKETVPFRPNLLAFTIPGELYDCNLPSLDPTLFSNKYFRSYNLKIEMRWSCGQRCESTVLKLPMSVASNRRELRAGDSAVSNDKKRSWWQTFLGH